MHIPDDQIERVRTAANLVEIVSAHVSLKRRGQNHVGLCPFHQEKTPSFTVSESKQIYHCFGCGEGGNAISFVMRIEGIDFPSAVRRLADRYGIALAVDRSGAGAKKAGDKDRARKVNDLALAFFRGQLAQAAADAPVRRYLAKRGLDAGTVEAFELGWAPDDWQALTAHALGRGASRDDLVLAGVAARRESDGRTYDRFRGRLIFPIRGTDGQVAGFGGRVIGEGEPKYLNSPETPLYHKGSLLYGLYQARRQPGRRPSIAVVEGYLDVIACHRHGLTDTVAPLGTALTEDHARMLSRHTDRVDLVFDGDAAGQAAARKAAMVLAPFSLDVRIVALPAGEDPDSLLAESGAEGFAACLEAGRPMMDFLIGSCLDGTFGTPIEQRLKAAEPVFEVLGRMADPLRKGHYLGRLAEALGVDERTLRRRFGAVRTAPAGRPAPAAPATPAPAGSPPHGEDLLMHLVLQGRVDARWLCERIAPESFTDPRVRRVAAGLKGLAAEGRSPDALLDRLAGEPEAAALVSGWLASDVTVEGDPADCALACVAALGRKETQEVHRRLLADIREAEASGDTARMMALLRQKDALKKAADPAAAVQGA
jgi:DNA primase